MPPTDPPDPILDFTTPPAPQRGTLAGAAVRLEPLDPVTHGDVLYTMALDEPTGDGGESLWRYMSVGPFADRGRFDTYLQSSAASSDPLFYTVVDQQSGAPGGVASYMRITPAQGVVEIGNIWFGAPLQRTRQATEAIYLLARHVFDSLGYRRLEWKCNALNEPSRRAALRFGFQYEGLFRQHMVVKGRNRDTTWFAMTDGDWSAAKDGFERWLAPENFDATGHQRRSLRELRKLI